MSPTLTTLLIALLFQLQVTVKQDRETIRNHATTISQILLIQDRQKIYLRKYGPYLTMLRWCESQFRDESINPKDTDGTRSYGRFQYKPRTFLDFGKEYGILPENTTLSWVKQNIMDGELQEKITVGMIKNGVNLFGQFPDCHRRYGFLLDEALAYEN